MYKRVSIKDIAEGCGVSIATVSRVINENGRYSEDTRQKVLAAIKEYDYKPNMIAKSLRVNQTKSIGVIVPDITNDFFSSIVLELENYFFVHGYSVFICNTSKKEEKEIEYLKSLDAKGVDGFIYISGIERNVAAECLKRDIPIVCIDRDAGAASGIITVESDNYTGGYLATEELIRSGCKNIILVKSRRKFSPELHRLEGYKKALSGHFLPVREELIFEMEDFSFESTKELVSGLVQQKMRFDGIFATKDWAALGALIALNGEGIGVPEQVKIVGYDNIPISQYSYPAITTINQNQQMLGVEAAKTLLDMIENKGSRIKNNIVIPVSLVKRSTT